MHARERTRTSDATHGVTILWPDDHHRRDFLATTGQPRLLVVPVGAPPPTITSPLEDWIREPIDPAELRVRIEELGRRADRRTSRLHLDEHGVLHHHGRWVGLSRVQQALVAPLVRDVGRAVPIETVVAAYASAGGRADPRPFRRALSRLRAQVADVGLQVHLLSGRAVLLEPVDDSGQFT